jgi:hypothetical protein
MLTTKKLKYNAVLIQSDPATDLAMAFMRFQEYYESPKFKNQIFTIGQHKAWYSQTYGADTYTKDWSGFNFPSDVLKPFREGLFDPLIKEETELLNLFKYRHDNFYIVGASSEETIRHELAHALFSYNNQYKFKINHICKIYAKELKSVKKYLLDKGYHAEVINDEIQAYVTDNDNDFIQQHLDNKVIKLINDTYKDYA